MSNIASAQLLAKYASGKIENSFYKTNYMVSQTSRVHVADSSRLETMYYVEPGSQKLKSKETLMR